MPRVLTTLICALALAACGGDDDSEQAAPPPAPPTAPQTSATLAPPDEPQEGLATAISEANPNLIDPARGDGAFVPWAERLKALKPALGRVIVDWAGLQPEAGAAAQLAVPRDGCLRTTPPCAPYAGISDQLARLRPSQGAGARRLLRRAGVGRRQAEGLRAAEHRAALAADHRPRTRRLPQADPPGHGPGAGRGRRGRGLERVERAQRPVLHQPAACALLDRRRPCRSAPTRGWRARMREDDRRQRQARRRRAGRRRQGRAARQPASGSSCARCRTTLLCEADVLAQHEYAELPEDEDAGDPVGEAEGRARRARCPGSKIPIWITETGDRRAPRRRGPPDGRRGRCAASARPTTRSCAEWHDDPASPRGPVHVPRGHGLPRRARRRRPDTRLPDLRPLDGLGRPQARRAPAGAAAELQGLTRVDGPARRHSSRQARPSGAGARARRASRARPRRRQLRRAPRRAAAARRMPRSPGRARRRARAGTS